jgi:hypothetical protein
MGLNEHLDARDEVEEEGHAAQVDAGLAPSYDPIEHGREDSHSRRRIKDRRNSEPEEVHFDSTLLVQMNSIL